MESNFDKKIATTKDLALKVMELTKLKLEIAGFSREVLEIQTAIHQLEKARTYLKDKEVRIVALNEYRNIVMTLHSQRKRKKEINASKKERESQKNIIENLIKSIKSKNNIEKSLPNMLIFPTKARNEQTE